MIRSAVAALACAAVPVLSFAAADAATDAFEADSARLARLLAEPQKDAKILWMKHAPVTAECGQFAEQRRLAQSLTARLDDERRKAGADAARREDLRRRSIVWSILAASPDAPARLSPTPFRGEIQESMLSLLGPGRYGAFVEDPAALDGRAIQIPGTHYEWCVMVMLNRIAFEPGARYRLRVRVRRDAAAQAGPVLTAGIFNPQTWSLRAIAHKNTSDIGATYDWHEICSFVPESAAYFWLAPEQIDRARGKSAFTALWLDAIAFERIDETPAARAAIIPAPRQVTWREGVCQSTRAPVVETVASLPPEGYELSVRPNGVTIRAADAAGAFYAQMTLRQLARRDRRTRRTSYPCVEISDAPKFRWRGVLIDTVRHFLGKESILRIIDQMSWYKLNVLQIHFTDDLGWTMEIPGLPELARHGVTRECSGIVACEKRSPLYYTTNDIKEIVAYAQSRHVKIVPEIEMPAHFGAALEAYPSLRCAVPGGGKAMCIGNPESLRFAEKVLDRVCELFPSDVIHIAGDECTRQYWKNCPRCRAHITRHGLKGVEELQPWLTRHLVTYLQKKGRRAIGWDEIFLSSAWEKWGDFLRAGGDSFNSLLPKTTMGMCWRPWGAGARAANRGYEIVRCPITYCYFDAGQSLRDDPFPYAGYHPVSLRKVYQFDPFEGVEPNARAKVVGAQCCNWAERTVGRVDLEWKLWPRALALSEVLWTYPDPTKRDFNEFSTRAAEHRRRLIRAQVNCAPLK
jgi:hexosaminidase